MTKYLGGSRPFLAVVLALAGAVAPAAAQDSNADARLRRLEAEVRSLKQQAGVAGTVAPQTSPTSSSAAPGVPASTPVADLLARMESIESQLARLTAQNEESGNKLRLLEERVAANEAAAKAAAAPVMAASTDTTTGPALVGPPADPAPTASSSNLSAMTAPAPKPAAPRPAAAPIPAPKPAAAAPAKPTPAAAAPSARRLAAVRAIVKPATGDAMEDEYTYGFRLWEAKFYPETRQQLQLFIDKYPRSSRVSYARNLIGRSLLDEGQPYEAARWFLQNYSTNDKGDRAPDSLLNLAEAMRQHKDNGKACQALTEFGSVYPREAAGRLKAQYDTLRGQLTCN